MISCVSCGGITEQATNKKETEKEVIEKRTNVIEVDEKTEETYYLLADFENYWECTQLKYENTLGKVTQIKKSENPDMVTYGKQSARLDIEGTAGTWHVLSPTMRISTTNAFFNLTTNFSNMERLTFDIYNAQDYETAIRFYIGPVVTQYTMGRLGKNMNDPDNTMLVIDLKPQQWNHIEIDASEIRTTATDANGQVYFVYGAEALGVVGAFLIEFDRADLHEKKQVYYVDNVRAYINEE